MADTMTLEQVLIESRIVANNGCVTVTRKNCAEWADAIDAAIKQREQDKRDAARFCWLFGNAVDDARAEVYTASLQTTQRFNIDDWRREIDAAMAKESGNG